MSETAARYLGFAFASADLLLEIDADDRVAFALGAAQRALGCPQEDLVGRPLRELIADDDQGVVRAVLEGLEPCARRGPVRVELARSDQGSSRRYAGFFACRLPQNAPRVSCALTLSPVYGPTAETKDEFGLLDREGFISTTSQVLEQAREAGLDLDLMLVELKGLIQAEASAPSGPNHGLLGRIAADLRAESYGGFGAARVGEEQFVILREGGGGAALVLERIGRAAEAEGARLEPSAVGVPLNDNAPATATLKALRFAIDRLLQDGAEAAGPAFGKVLEEIVSEANKLGATVRANRFNLAYQPIVELRTGKVSHYEALLRLPGSQSPSESIQLAEELDLIADLDLAVLDQVITKLRSAGSEDIRIAANISARSLMLPRFLGEVFARLALVQAEISQRLILEITETAVLHDLDKANAAIQRFRQSGFPVHLDDFGSGAATLAYLRTLTIDAVKIDGQYISDIAESDRNRTLVSHIVKLCRELGVETIGEHVETRAIADMLMDLRVRYGQGWLFGRPTLDPARQPAAAPQAQRAAVA